MTKERFLGNLEYALHFMPDAEREATLNFYSEMIDDRMEDGLTEEEAVDQMEKPEEIEQRLRRTQEAQSDEADGSRENKNGADENVDKNDDWETRSVTYPAASISDISIRSDNLPVHLYRSEDDTVRMTYFTCAEDPYTLTLENGHMLLTHPGFSARSGRDLFESISDLMNNLSQAFSGTRYSIKAGAYIDLSVPAGFGGAVFIATSNARVRVEHASCHAGVTVRSSNGRITVDDSDADFFDLQTFNARVSVNDVKTRANVLMRSTNGRLEIKDSVLFGMLDAATSNGTISVDGVSADDIRLKTSNGSIIGTLKGSMSDYAIESHTSNGHNSLPDGTQGRKHLSAKTSNGSIRIRFAE